jgi:hypothetical protein
MIWGFVQFVTNSRLARLIGTALAAVAAVLTFGAWERRKGVAQANAKVAAEKAADFAETTKEVSREKISADPVDDVRDRLRDRAKRKP